MESEVKQRNDSIKSCVKLVFLYILFVMGLSTIVEGQLRMHPRWDASSARCWALSTR